MSSAAILKVLLISIFTFNLIQHLPSFVEADDSVCMILMSIAKLLLRFKDLNIFIQIQSWINDEIYDFSSSAAWEAGKRSKVWIFAMDPAVMDTMKLLKRLLFWVELFIARKILWEPCFWNPPWIGQARKKIMFTRHYIGRRND